MSWWARFKARWAWRSEYFAYCMRDPYDVDGNRRWCEKLRRQYEELWP